MFEENQIDNLKETSKRKPKTSPMPQEVTTPVSQAHATTATSFYKPKTAPCVFVLDSETTTITDISRKAKPQTPRTPHITTPSIKITTPTPHSTEATPAHSSPTMSMEATPKQSPSLAPKKQRRRKNQQSDLVT